MAADYDLVVIGGGINGCGIARDAAGRGVSVLLAEMGDLAGATSSASTKLIHGGLRYLEYYEFRLVREALKEREVLLNAAPHIAWPLRFILPHHKDLRPAWFLRLGLFMYDHLGGRKILPGTKTVPLNTAPFNEGLKPLFRKGFEYSDCWVEDSRLVSLNARAAADLGADVRTRTKCVSARREDGLWSINLKNVLTGETTTVTAKVMVNAAGPWVAEMLSGVVGANQQAKVRLVKGSHIVINRQFSHDRCFIFQNADGRIVFAIPYEQDFTLVGTTDLDYEGDPGDVRISESEVSYLCDAVSEYLMTKVEPKDVVHTYSGVRPLYDDGASEAKAATRDYVLEMDEGEGRPPLLSIFGGKITTYRRLAESALAKLTPHLPFTKDKWTADVPLPGGDFSPLAFETEVGRLKSAFPFLDNNLALRLVRAYGTDAHNLLQGTASLADLGTCFGGNLYEAEVRWLMEQEWAVTAEDVLWRRSKMGLRLSDAEASVLDAWMGRQNSAVAHKSA